MSETIELSEELREEIIQTYHIEPEKDYTAKELSVIFDCEVRTARRKLQEMKSVKRAIIPHRTTGENVIIYIAIKEHGQAC